MPGFTNVYIDLTSPQLGGKKTMFTMVKNANNCGGREGRSCDGLHPLKGGGRGDHYHALIPLREKSPRGANEQASPSQIRSAQLRQHMKSHCQNDSATVITGVTRLSKRQHSHCQNGSAAKINGAIEHCQDDSAVTPIMICLFG